MELEQGAGQGASLLGRKALSSGLTGDVKMCRSVSDAWEQDTPALSCSLGYKICYKTGA